LRQAIFDACPGSTITLSQIFTITLQSELVIDKTLTIIGGSANVYTNLEGGDTVRIMNITSPSATLNLTGLIIRNGRSDGGGAIRSVGNLNLSSAFVRNSSTITDTVGGGIYVAGGTLAISGQSLVSNNSGGGIYLCGTTCGQAVISSAVIKSSLIAGNQTTASSNGGGGVTL